MASDTPTAPQVEREFYLREFRGRTIAIALPQLRDPDLLEPVLRELTGSGTRIVLIAQERESLDKLVEGCWLDADGERLEARAWRSLRSGSRLGIQVAPGTGFLAAARRLAVRLGVFKLVLIDPAGGIVSRARRCSFAHLEELRTLAADPEAAARCELLREVEELLVEGVPSVNLCSLDGLRDELLTYAGSGTLFTRERYVTVRRLGIDDFDAASDLLARGLEEGFLVPRRPEELDRVLANGFGAFVEDRHLAGICALLPFRESGAGEIASMYAITRFLGEGVGSHLVSFARDRARHLGLRWLFACTTSARAARFFERHGFRAVPPDQLPSAKWADYDSERRRRLRCFRHDLGDPWPRSDVAGVAPGPNGARLCPPHPQKPDG